MSKKPDVIREAIGDAEKVVRIEHWEMSPSALKRYTGVQFPEIVDEVAPFTGEQFDNLLQRFRSRNAKRVSFLSSRPALPSHTGRDLFFKG